MIISNDVLLFEAFVEAARARAIPRFPFTPILPICHSNMLGDAEMSQCHTAVDCVTCDIGWSRLCHSACVVGRSCGVKRKAYKCKYTTLHAARWLLLCATVSTLYS